VSISLTVDLISDFNSSRHAQVTSPQTMYEIRMQLHSVSTGLFHPQAEQPIISVVVTPWQRPAIGIEIVGDNLVLILTHYGHPAIPDDQVFVYQWKTGNLKMVSDSQLASVPLHCTFVRASPLHSTRMLDSSFSLQTFFYCRMRMLSDWNTGRFLQIMYMSRHLDHSLPFLSRGSREMAYISIFRAVQTPIRRRLSFIAQNHFMPIRIMQLLSLASLSTSQMIILKWFNSLVIIIVSPYLSIAALSFSVWIDIPLLSHMQETRLLSHTLNGVHLYVVG